jgi:hypothetical protein
MDGMGAADRIHAGFRQAEIADLSLLDQLFHRADDIFHRHFGVDAMLIEKVDRFDLEPAKAALDGAPDLIGTAADPTKMVAGSLVDVPAEFGGDLDLIPQRRQRLADHLLIGPGVVNCGSVEEIDPALDRLTNERDHFRAILDFTGFAIAHAAECEGGDFEAAMTRLLVLSGLHTAFRHFWELPEELPLKCFLGFLRCDADAGTDDLARHQKLNLGTKCSSTTPSTLASRSLTISAQQRRLRFHLPRCTLR